MPNTDFLFQCGADNFGTTGYPANSVFTTIFTTAAQVGIYPGRIDGYALFLDSSGSGITKTFANRQTLGVLFAFDVVTPVSGLTFFALMDGASAQLIFTFDGARRLQVSRGSTANVLATSVEAFNQDTWHHLEIVPVIDNSAGSVEVRLNGNPTPIINVTGVDTQVTANAYCNVAYWLSNGTQDIAIDDIIIREHDGLTPTSTWMGNTHIGKLVVNGAGSYTEWTPSTGANWQNVDENPPSTTDYNAASTIGLRDTYAHASSALSAPTVYCVALTFIAELDAAGSSTFAAIFDDGTVYEGAVLTPAAGSYTGLTELFMENPSTSLPWDISEVNSGYFGMIVKS